MHVYVYLNNPQKHSHHMNIRNNWITIKGVPSFLSFLSYFKTLSVGPALGIEPAISRSAVKRFTVWSWARNPSTVGKLVSFMKSSTLPLGLFKVRIEKEKKKIIKDISSWSFL